MTYPVLLLKYSLAKLCGTPVQYENKGKRSYEKSIERTIELIGSYLKNENCREICLYAVPSLYTIFSMADYYYEKDNMDAFQCLLNIYKIYPMLSEKIKKAETQLDKDGKKLIVSKRYLISCFVFSSPSRFFS